MRHHWLIHCVLVILLTLTAAAQERRPNFVIIFADDLGLGDIVFEKPALANWYKRYSEREAFKKTFYEGARLTDIFGKDD